MERFELVNEEGSRRRTRKWRSPRTRTSIHSGKPTERKALGVSYRVDFLPEALGRRQTEAMVGPIQLCQSWRRAETPSELGRSGRQRGNVRRRIRPSGPESRVGPSSPLITGCQGSVYDIREALQRRRSHVRVSCSRTCQDNEQANTLIHCYNKRSDHPDRGYAMHVASLSLSCDFSVEYGNITVLAAGSVQRL